MDELKPNEIIFKGATPYEIVGSIKKDNETHIVVRSDPHLDKGALNELMKRADLETDDIRTEEDDEVAKFALTIRETRAWRNLIGKDLEIPEPPTLLIETMRKLREVLGENHHFEPHYLPEGKLYGNGRNGMEIGGVPHEFPEGFGTVDPTIFVFIDRGMMDADIITLPGAWIIMDTTMQPKSNGGRYVDDPLAPLLTRLNGEGKIHNLVPDRRNGVSYLELRDAVVPEFADLLGFADRVRSGSVSIDAPNLAELHIITNMYRNAVWDSSYPELTRSRISTTDINRIIADWNQINGMRETGYQSIPESINEFLNGFRLMIRFPKN